MKAEQSAQCMSNARVTTYRQPESLAVSLIMCLLIVLGSWSVSLTVEPIAPMSIDEEETPSAVSKASEGDVDVQVLHVGDRWTYDGFFDVAEMITNAGVETDAAALTGELDMWVDDVRTITSSNGVDTSEDHNTCLLYTSPSPRD